MCDAGLECVDGECALGGGDDVIGFRYTMAIFSTLATILFLITAWYAERQFADLATMGLERLQRALFDHIQTLSLSFFDRQPLGQLMSRITNDTEFVALVRGFVGDIQVRGAGGGYLVSAEPPCTSTIGTASCTRKATSSHTASSARQAESCLPSRAKLRAATTQGIEYVMQQLDAARQVQIAKYWAAEAQSVASELDDTVQPYHDRVRAAVVERATDALEQELRTQGKEVYFRIFRDYFLEVDDLDYGAVAARTKNMRIGYGVRLLPAPYNHPIRTAESVAVLDLISDGRVDFGTGRSSTRAELEGTSRHLRRHHDITLEHL